VTLSIVVAWIALVGAVACLPLVIPLLDAITGGVDQDGIRAAIGPSYACLVFGITAVVILLLVLYDIRRGKVFTVATVTRLRLISYCGFAILLACVAGAIVAQGRAIFILLAVVAGFLGLLMRVIKNVIDAARLLQEDSDSTI
jgi:hypothetical protein